MTRQKQILILLYVLIFCTYHMQGFRGLSTFVARPQGVDGAQELLAWLEYVQAEETGAQKLCIMTPEYYRSFRPEHITCYLMNAQTVTFSGSRVPNRSSRDILADYFGLPSDFQSTIYFDPTIASVQLDAAGYFQLCKREHCGWFDELTLFIHAPITHTRWDLNLKEKIINSGTNFQPAGYMGKGDKDITRNQLSPDAKTSLQGAITFGDMLEPMQFGKIDSARSLTRVADVEVALGWHGGHYSGSHGGLSLFVTVPTGTRTRAEFLFAPQVGNNHHWELGGCGYAYFPVWHRFDGRKGCGCSTFALALSARIGHLFETRNKRSFDLKPNGRGSRYMLLETMGTAVDDIVQIPAGSTLQTQYLGLLIPAIDKTTFDCRISIGIQAEFTCALCFIYNAWQFDAGYNFWGRSKEHLVSRDHLAQNRFSVKGDASLYGFVPGANPYYLGLNATQSNATLNAGQGAGNTNFANLNADNATPAATLRQLTTADSISLGIPLTFAGGSTPPILLTDANIDECSALSPETYTNKFFVQGSYALPACERTDWYVGAGAQVEIAGKHDTAFACASQWAIWFHARVSY